MRGDVLGGGQPCGLAAAPQNTTGSHSETFCIELVLGEKAQRPMRFTGEVPWRGMVGLEGVVGPLRAKAENVIFF